VPGEIKKLNEDDFQSAVYKVLMTIPIQPALETTSASFKTSEEYGLTAYVKTAEWVYLLQQAAGMEKVDSAFHNYFNKWKFKHPQPSDMKASFEEALHVDLARYFALLNKEDKLVD
jgi:aminopeptidase N